MKKILLVAFALSIFACSKKSGDSPTPSNSINTTNTPSDSNNDKWKYEGAYVVFKGKLYSNKTGNGSTSPIFGTKIVMTSIGIGFYGNDIYKAKNPSVSLDMNMSSFHDIVEIASIKSEQFKSILNKKFVVFNGYQFGYDKFEGAADYVTLESALVKYSSHKYLTYDSDVNKRVSKKNTIFDTSKYYWKITKIDSLSSTFDYVRYKCNGEFFIPLTNVLDTNEILDVSGYFVGHTFETLKR